MSSPVPYCHNPYHYQRRHSREVKVGKVGVGGANPIRVQSMLTCDTMDTRECVKQTLDLVKVGCEIVRITAPTVKDAANLKNIKAELTAAGCDVPIVADIHFKPDAAMEAAQWVEKVRVNPGNFADKKKFAIREYTDDQYEEELARIDETFKPLVDLCKARGISMRIGTNHGSLSDRIMNRFGDTPLGMVESAVEFARIARKYGYHDFIFSMKSSNPKVMINAYRMLAARLLELGPDWNYPLHLGVTEAGDGEDGRIKSAIGIGALLADGIGDTIRVSLTEDSVHEIPVARALVSLAAKHASDKLPPQQPPLSFDPFVFARRASEPIALSENPVGGPSLSTRVGATRDTYAAIEHKRVQLGDLFPDFVAEKESIIQVDPRDGKALDFLANAPTPHLVTIADGCDLSPIVAYRYLAAQIPARHPILLKDTFNPPAAGAKPDVLDTMLSASANIGALLCDGIGDAILVRGEPGPGAGVRLAFNILQSVGNRIFKTDYVACPSCGRTLFNLQSTTAKIREATNHLKGVKIAIMGCIVNGPGEMADADFGYVGGAPGKVNLYIGKTPVKFNIPETEAVARL
ncbi:MAG TPA: (E)-4-hydroxy-3-methylbut-2-enyl-diphosphate synthase, partial [Candidatus Methylacidiphilales bacterium]|nr:(E)-4-hydroxy-3-methylbut-2-enyl-diphosphate synthase [Candidatus Methylacidiphilales bacterium]